MIVKKHDIIMFLTFVIGVVLSVFGESMISLAKDLAIVAI